MKAMQLSSPLEDIDVVRVKSQQAEIGCHIRCDFLKESEGINWTGIGFVTLPGHNVKKWNLRLYQTSY
jgi:hypothetical protein